MSGFDVLTFGDFELSPRRRTLTHAGRRLRVGSRAMDILLLLAARPGELVTKDEIQERLWPGIFVDEAGVRVHLSSLRKALGAQGQDYIHTVAGRGYILVPPVARSLDPEVDPPARRLHLPFRLERLIGRGDAVGSLAEQMLARRFVTIVGPGGIGKTSVALEVAARVGEAFADGVRFVDLSALEDQEAAPGALAIALGLPGLSDLSAEALAKPLDGKRLLILLDNCERQADVAARLGEALLRSAPGVRVLATSRETLRAEGEWLHRLPPLTTPAEIPASLSDALSYSAIELFVDRADAAHGGYRLEADDLPCVAEICRRLDGLPLAIELAATTVPTLGVRGVAAGLDDRLALLTGGRRTAQSRHQTLRAALDWSYDLLSREEQRVLEALGVISGAFDLALGSQVAAQPDESGEDVRAVLGRLAGKSLLTVEAGGRDVRYRLLESTRAYALEKLSASAARDTAMRCYAAATLDFFRVRQSDWERIGSETWLGLHASRLEDARAVLEWAFSGTGDRDVGRALTAALCGLWLHLGLARECLAWCRKALSAATDVHEMSIRNAFGVAHGFTHGNNMGNRDHMVAALEIARTLGDYDYRMRGLWGLASIDLNDGNFDGVLHYARQLRESACGPQAAAERLVGERMIGSALHLQGWHAEARTILQTVADALADPTLRASSARFQFDQQVLARGFLAWVHWIEGDAAESRRQVEAAVAEATRIEHAGSLGFALDSAVALEMLHGDLTAAADIAKRLSAMGANVGFETWIVRSEILSAIVQVRSGDLDEGVPRLQAALTPAARKMSSYRTPFFLAELAEAEAAAGLPEKSLATIDEAIAWFGAVDDYWCAPECFRVKADVLRLHTGDNAAREADGLLERAVTVAQMHGAKAWLRRIELSRRHVHRDPGDRVREQAQWT